MLRYVLTLPEEPPLSAVIELLDGVNKGERYRRYSNDKRGWRRVGVTSDASHDWSEVWWAVTEDAGGGTSIRVFIPDSDDPHPRPWNARNGVILDALGVPVPAEHVVSWANFPPARPECIEVLP